MPINISIPAYRRYGDEVNKALQGQLTTWGEVKIGIVEGDEELVSIYVEDTNEGSSKNTIKPEDLKEALGIIMEQYNKRLEQTKTQDQKLR